MSKVERAYAPRRLSVDIAFVFVTIHIINVMLCSADKPEQPPTVTPTNRVACSWKNLVTYLPVSTNPVATSFVGVSQIAFSTWTDSAVGNWHVPTTSMFCSCWKGKWRLGLSWHRFKSWRDFDSFCVGKCLWAFRITSLKFEFWGEKGYFGSPSIVIGA